MKRLISILALLGVVVTASAQPAIAHRTFNFIQNGTYMIVSNNYTWTYGTAPSTYFVPFNATTNIFSDSTTNNYAQTINPIISDFGAGGIAPALCDANGNQLANASISFTLQIPTNYPLPTLMSAWGGTVSPLSTTNVPTANVATNVSSTNYVTFTFAKSVDGVNFGTTTQDKFSFGYQLAAGVPVTQTTNLPTSFTQGARKIRLLTIQTSSSASSPGVIVNAIGLGGYYP